MLPADVGIGLDSLFTASGFESPCRLAARTKLGASVVTDRQDTLKLDDRSIVWFKVGLIISSA